MPPNQGGKYSGFGYSRDPPSKTQSQEIIDSTLSSLASVTIKLYQNVSYIIIYSLKQGWSLLSAGASKIASTAKEKAVTTVSLASSKV